MAKRKHKPPVVAHAQFLKVLVAVLGPTHPIWERKSERSFRNRVFMRSCGAWVGYFLDFLRDGGNISAYSEEFGTAAEAIGFEVTWDSRRKAAIDFEQEVF